MNPAANTPLAGRYVLIDQIGAGGMGSVWRAWDLKNQKFLAAKVLGQHDSGMLLRFVREQSVRIRHPHVVAPSGWAAEDNLVVFTMDLVKGGSIQTLLGDHGKLPESYVAVVLDQTLQALEAVHNAGVVHRDVKPANLLLEPTGTRRPHVRLSDFGVAALIDEVRLTRFPGAIGTDGYMAPEQAHGAAPEPQQDLYALGVVGIQMLTGLSPRNQKGVPDGRLKELLEELTEHDSEKRVATASDALQKLRSIGVPAGTPWLDDPEPPEVFNQLTDVPPPPPSYFPGSFAPSAPGGYPTPTPWPGQPPQQGSPFAPPPSRGPGGPGSGASGSGPGSSGSGAGPGSGAPASYAGPGSSGSGAPPAGVGFAGPGSGASGASGAGSSGGGAYLSPGLAGNGPSSHGGSNAPSYASGIRPAAAPPKTMLIVAIVCFLVALGLAGAALWLIVA